MAARKLRIALMCATAGLSGVASQVARAQSERAATIPSEPLASALDAFREQTHVRLSYDRSLVTGRTSPGGSVSGDPATTLQALLAGTGLAARRIDDRSFAIELAQTQVAGSNVLGTVHVESGADANESATSDPAASQGTGSYAARATTIFKTPLAPREIPLTISVLTRQRLDDQNLFSIPDALAQAPGLSVTRNAGGEDFSIFSRGYSVNTEVDGVPFSFGSTSSTGTRASRFDTAIYDRIEVLRGPAGVLQGVGDIGGSINLVRKRPTKEFSATGQLSVGSWNDFHGVMDVGGPVNQSGSVRARFVGAYEDQDYFYDYVSSKHLTAYGVVEIDLGTRTTLGLTASRTYSDRRGQYYGIPEALTGQIKRSTYPGVKSTGAEIGVTELGADVTHDFGGDWIGKVRYIHRTDKYEYRFLAPLVIFPDDDGMVRPTSSAFFLVYAPQGTDTNNAVDGSVSGPIHVLGGTHKLTVGANYERARISRGAPSDVVMGTAISPDIPPVAFGPDDNVSHDLLTQYAPYMDAKIALLKGFSLSAGGRYTRFSNKTRSNGQDLFTFTKSKGHFTPYGGLVWDATKHLSFYGSYADIFEPQTEKDFFGNFLLPTTGWQAEGGAKASFWGDRLTGSVAYYRIRRRNVAFPDPDPTHVNCGSDGGTCYVSLGLDQSQGVEAEITGSPLAGLQLQASYTYNKNKYLRDGFDRAGQAIETSTPQHQFKLWSIYQFGTMKRADVGRFSIGGGMIAQSRIYFDDKAFGQKAYAVFDAQVGYRPTENSQMTLSVNNILDANYLSSVGPFNFFGEPRAFLLSLRFGR